MVLSSNAADGSIVPEKEELTLILHKVPANQKATVLLTTILGKGEEKFFY